MSENYKIPYSFDTPVPSIFRKKGWHKDHKAWAYITWAFARCRSYPNSVYWKPREIQLEPFEFISGREKCAEETGLSPQEVRTQQEKLISSGYLQKSTSKSTSKFTVYKWVTARFNEYSNQQMTEEATSNQPATNHNIDTTDTLDALEEQQQQGVVGSFSFAEKEGSTKVVPIYHGWRVDETNDEKIAQAENNMHYRTLEETIRLLRVYNFQDEDIQWLRDNSNLIRVTLAIKHVQTTKNIDNPIGFIKWHVQQTKIPDLPKKKLTPQELVRLHFKHGEFYNNAECFIDEKGIAFQRGMNLQHVKFTDYGFSDQYHNMLRKLDIRIPENQQTG